jgi:hypothetical protein
MKIVESQLDLSSQHHAEVKHQRQERLEIWRDGEVRQEQNPPVTRDGLNAIESRLRAEAAAELRISEEAQKLQPAKAEAQVVAKPTNIEELEVSMIKLLVEYFTGRKLELFDPNELSVADSETPEQTSVAQSAEQADSAGWGLIYDSYESHLERESSHFTASGLVQTEDGQSIAVNLELNMSREFFSQERISIRAGDAHKDPLVLNFNGGAAELTQRDFSFDLDLDGREDQIAFVRPGSGFLALDRNGDGVINNGSELFGPSSGDGFSELAAHDGDGNGWIDENDSIYSRLRIWSKDAAGNDRLVGLGQQGVGAIYLGSVATPLKLADQENNTLGQIRESGLYLREDGVAGSVQQLDLVV